jgi:hypothetical protein
VAPGNRRLLVAPFLTYTDVLTRSARKTTFKRPAPGIFVERLRAPIYLFACQGPRLHSFFLWPSQENSARTGLCALGLLFRAFGTIIRANPF